MKMEIIGKRFGTFTNKQGDSVVYRTLYVKSPLKQKDGSESEGYTSEKIGVTRCLTDDDMRMLSLGDIIDVVFNRYGGVESVDIYCGSDGDDLC